MKSHNWAMSEEGATNLKAHAAAWKTPESVIPGLPLLHPFAGAVKIDLPWGQGGPGGGKGGPGGGGGKRCSGGQVPTVPMVPIAEALPHPAAPPPRQGGDRLEAPDLPDEAPGPAQAGRKRPSRAPVPDPGDILSAPGALSSAAPGPPWRRDFTAGCPVGQGRRKLYPFFASRQLILIMALMFDSARSQMALTRRIVMIGPQGLSPRLACRWILLGPREPEEDPKPRGSGCLARSSRG